MRSVLSAIVLAAAASLLGGCSIPSLNPLATEDTVVKDEGLVGTWIPQEEDGSSSKDEKYIIKSDGEKKFIVTVMTVGETEKKRQEFAIQLVKLGEYQFIDMTLTSSAKDDLSRYGTTVAPLHNFFKAKRDGDSLTIWALDNDAFDKGLKDGSIKLQYAKYGEHEDAVITASTKDLQAYFTKNGDNAKLFEEPKTLKRQSKK